MRSSPTTLQSSRDSVKLSDVAVGRRLVLAVSKEASSSVNPTAVKHSGFMARPYTAARMVPLLGSSSLLLEQAYRKNKKLISYHQSNSINF